MADDFETVEMPKKKIAQPKIQKPQVESVPEVQPLQEAVKVEQVV